MVNTSVIFDPEIDERKLDREVDSIDKKLGETGQITPEIDERQLDEVQLDGVVTGINGDGGGGGMGKFEAASLAISERTLKYQKLSANEDTERNQILERWGRTLNDIRNRIPALRGGQQQALPGDTIDIGGGGGMGAGGTAGAAGLASRLPKPISGVLSGSVMPIALAGGIGVGLLSSMQKASSRLQTSNALLGVAHDNFFREPGNILDEHVARPISRDILASSLEWDKHLRSGEWIQSVTGALSKAAGYLEVLPGVPDTLSSISLAMDAFASGKITLPQLNWGKHIPDLGKFWNDLGGWPDVGSLWNQIGGWPDVKGMWDGWPNIPSVDLSSFVTGTSLGSFVTGTNMADHVTDVNLATKVEPFTDAEWDAKVTKWTDTDWNGHVDPWTEQHWGSKVRRWQNWSSKIQGVDLKKFVDPAHQESDDDTGDDGCVKGPKPGPNYRWSQSQCAWIWTGESGGRGGDDGGPTPVQRGGVVMNRTQATIGEAGPEVVQPLSEFRRLMEGVAREAARAGGSRGGGSVDMSRVENELQGLRRDIKDLARAMSNSEVTVDGETFGRVVFDKQRNAVTDTDPLVSR